VTCFRTDTSYEPYNMNTTRFHRDNVPDEYSHTQDNELVNDEVDLQYLDFFHGNSAEIVALSREVPAPGIMYSDVIVHGSVVKDGQSKELLPNYTKYKFEVFTKSLLGLLERSRDRIENVKRYWTDEKSTLYQRSLVIKDYTSRVGNLKSTTLYDRNDNKITETINHYLHDEIEQIAENDDGNDQNVEDDFESNWKVYEREVKNQFASQGIIQESYVDARYTRVHRVPYPYGGVWHSKAFLALIGTITTREKYPVINTGQTTVNYKTGITSTNRNLGFDFYSGQPNKMTSQDGMGNYSIIEKLLHTGNILKWAFHLMAEQICLLRRP